MNFFEYQETARRHSVWIIGAFIAVALLIVLAVDIIVIFVLSAGQSSSLGAVSNGTIVGLSDVFRPQFWSANTSTLVTSSVVTGSVIGLSSIGKIASLRGGGGTVARNLGGVLVTPDVSDPLRRRFYNVVEEIALASGVPIPDVFVLENEAGINAFAAGYSPADAAVAVTQGTLEKLNRAELQGVVAHEFSHIFNGDMRINIRLMGVIFGITVLAILGRKLLNSQRRGISRSNRENGSAIALAGVALMLVGYIGLFFARWMKSALSRQREYLADASAVQFTRDPSGIAGALKKIAAHQHSSYLVGESEEVSHMLFGSGAKSLMFATHPPLVERIGRIEKNFDSGEIEKLARKLKAQELREHVQAEQAAQELANKTSGERAGIAFDQLGLFDSIGNPQFGRILAAAMLAADLPEGLNDAAHSLEWAPEVLFLCLLDNDESLREKQLYIINQEMGDISEHKVAHLVAANKPILAEHRLPLLEICFPALKRRPVEDIKKILNTIQLLVLVDNQIDSFEYLLSRLVQQYLRESKDPSRTRLHGNKKLEDVIPELSTVVSNIASHGQTESGAEGLQQAQKAYRAAMDSIGIRHTNLRFSDGWQRDLDKAIKQLNKLKPADKAKVVKTLAMAVAQDQKIITAEHEMLRAICSLLHVPLPYFSEAIAD